MLHDVFYIPEHTIRKCMAYCMTGFFYIHFISRFDIHYSAISKRGCKIYAFKKRIILCLFINPHPASRHNLYKVFYIANITA